MDDQTFIAKCAIDHYESILPRNKGKPKQNEWTVYAAIVANTTADSDNRANVSILDPKNSKEDDFWVVSCATGTKCTTIPSTVSSTNFKDCILHDSHAEVLARRGLLRVLWKEIIDHNNQRETVGTATTTSTFVNPPNSSTRISSPVKIGKSNQNGRKIHGKHDHSLLEPIPVMNQTKLQNDESSNCKESNTKGEEEKKIAPPNEAESKQTMEKQQIQFRLRPNIRLHLYVSDSPCGDASIFPLTAVNGSTDTSNSHNEKDDNDMNCSFSYGDNTNVSFTGAKIVLSSSNNKSAAPPTSATTATTEHHTKNSISKQNDDVSRIENKPLFNNPSNLTSGYVDDAPFLGERLKLSSSSPAVATTTATMTTSTGMNTTGNAVTNAENVSAPNSTSDDIIDSVCCVAREPGQQLLGRLRTKSGRSNLPAHLRSTSMSCSDKLVRWGVLGLQGSLLMNHIPDPIRFTSVVVSRHPQCASIQQQRSALKRAVSDRIAKVRQQQRYPITAKSSSSFSVTKETLSTEVISSSTAKLAPTMMPAAYIVTKRYFENNFIIPSVHIHQDIVSFGKAVAATAALTSKTASHATTKTNVVESADADFEQDSNSQQQLTQQNQTQKKRKRSSDADSSASVISPCGVSMNWQQICPNDDVELVVGARGIRQGKKPKRPEDYGRLASRLSRYELHKLALAVKQKSVDFSQEQGTIVRGKDIDMDDHCKQESEKNRNSNTDDDDNFTDPSASCFSSAYIALKNRTASLDYKEAQSLIYRTGPLEGWIRS